MKDAFYPLCYHVMAAKDFAMQSDPNTKGPEQLSMLNLFFNREIKAEVEKGCKYVKVDEQLKTVNGRTNGEQLFDDMLNEILCVQSPNGCISIIEQPTNQTTESK